MACDPEGGFLCGPASGPQFLWNSHSPSASLKNLEPSQDQGWGTHQSVSSQSSRPQADPDPLSPSLSCYSSSMSSPSSG